MLLSLPEDAIVEIVKRVTLKNISDLIITCKSKKKNYFATQFHCRAESNIDET